MAVISVDKVHIIVHKSIKDTFLDKLQTQGIIHITELKDAAPRSSKALDQLNGALEQLTGYKKKHPLETFIKIKRPIDFNDFQDMAGSFDYHKVVAQLEKVRIEREKNEQQLRVVTENIEFLLPWVSLEYNLDDLRSLRQTTAIPCEVSSKQNLEALPEILADIPHSCEMVHSTETASHCIFYVKKEQEQIMRSRLIENDCDTIDFRDFVGTPQSLIATFEKNCRDAGAQIEELNDQERTLSHEISRLEVLADHIANEHTKEEIADSLPETARTTHIVGWIKTRDTKRLEKLIAAMDLAVYEKIEPDPDEHAPVALKNSKWSRPYEELIKLYSMPKPNEFDPTPFLAVFFPIFFALCITDALYGIFLIFFSLYLLKKVSGNRNLIWILFAGGILTIFSGAMVGGWAGDLFDYIGFQPLIMFKQSFVLFDPLKNPMIFIAIAVGLGFVHMMVGIAIEIFDSMKNGEYDQAVFANLTWFVLLPSILLYFTLFASSMLAKATLEFVMWFCIVGIIVASHPEGKPSALDQIVLGIILWLLWYALTSSALSIFGFTYTIQIPVYTYAFIVPLLIIEVIRSDKAKKALGKIAWGLYNLYGISSYLGVVLSYVRLMALGMVTGVIAIAINKIAWMITGIPVLGVILVIFILVPSHLFNIVINVLGGFIHTMRLQYIEFFGRFYSGGSKAFKPFGFETKYVEIE